MQVLWVFGDDYSGDLADQIEAQVDAGRAVLWLSASGTRSLYRSEEGVMVRTRQSAGNTHIADRMPIVVARPFTATSCGCGDGSGYRSTAPALVAVVETAEDVQDAWDAACDALEDVTQEQWDAVTSGHPIEECGALYCRVRLAVRPAGVDARRVTR